MKISEIKNLLPTLDTVVFEKQNGTLIPEHFHVTEIGVVTKHFIDCGGTLRNKTAANFQLWNANDFDHRLKPAKLLNIIALSEKKLGMGDLEIEVEYQSETIGTYTLGFNGKNFILLSTQTDCLAKNNCGVPETASEKTSNGCCTPSNNTTTSCC